MGETSRAPPKRLVFLDNFCIVWWIVTTFATLRADLTIAQQIDDLGPVLALAPNVDGRHGMSSTTKERLSWPANEAAGLRFP